MPRPDMTLAGHLITLTLAVVAMGCTIQRPAGLPDLQATVDSAVHATVAAMPTARQQTVIQIVVTATPAERPTAMPELAEQSTPAPDVPAIEILSHRSYSQMGMLMIVGEIRNNTAVTVSYVFIYATLYDKDNNVIGTGTGVAAMESVPPGGKSPFQVMSTEWTGLDHYALQVQVP